MLSITPASEYEVNPFMKGFIQENTDQSYKFDKVYQESYDDSYDALLIARNLFDLREFKKCAHLIKDYAKNPKYQSAMFLYYYSLFMNGELRKEEEIFENGGKYHPLCQLGPLPAPQGNHKTSANQELSHIEADLAPLYNQNQLNELNMYLYGIVLKEQMKKTEAREVFIKVLNLFPCFWSAWLELCRLIEGEDVVSLT